MSIMSIMCCIYVPEGIIMAADSRITRTKPTKTVDSSPTDGKENQKIQFRTTYTLSDNAQKVLLIKKAGVGVSFCGDAMIDGMTVSDFIRKFEIDRVDEDDTTEIVSQKLLDYYQGQGTHFFVCGYDNDIPYVYDVYNKCIQRSNIINTPIPEEAAADPTIGTPENLKTNNAVKLSSETPSIRYGATWAGQKTAITKIVNNPPIMNADWNTMQLKDAIDFAEFLIDTTIKYERFSDDIQTCGGDIDILVITKDDAFWKQHKIYNPSQKS